MKELVHVPFFWRLNEQWHEFFNNFINLQIQFIRMIENWFATFEYANPINAHLGAI